MFETIPEEKSWQLVELTQAAVRPLGLAVTFFATLALAGYLLSWEQLYRPVSDGPATHPVTALCMLLIGIGLFSNHGRARYVLIRCCALTVSALMLARLLDASLGTQILNSFTPFQERVELELSAEKNNYLGTNSALMLLMIGLSMLQYSYRRYTLSQLLASIALAMPTISLVGYCYGIKEFYGQMSPLTMASGYAMALGAMALTAKYAALRALLSPYLAGQVARIQTLVGLMLPVILGYVMIATSHATGADLVGMLVVSIAWLSAVMTSISAIYQENTDLRRRESERQLARAAMYDTLTGLSNRRYFFERGAQEIERAARTSSPIGVLIIDVDYFKRINDSAGHDMGDRVLIEVSQCLKHSVRAVDLVSRIGGEEFAVLVDNVNEQQTTQVANKIRENIKALIIPGWSENHGDITVSIGCSLNNGHCSLEQSLKVADAALYRAKRNGRNSVFMILSSKARREPHQGSKAAVRP